VLIMPNKTERKWGAKTTIGDAAAQASWDKNWAKNESRKATSDRVGQARNEADAEVKREMRGKDLSTQEQEMVQEVQDEKMRRRMKAAPTTKTEMGEAFAKGGSVSSASKRADGCAQRGKTRGMIV
jgi:hypothetical protein